MSELEKVEIENAVPNSENNPPLWMAVIPLLFLFAALGFNVYVYGDDSLSGANQVALIAAAALAAGLALYLKFEWTHIQNKILDNIRAATPANLILLLVGALTGTWLISGIVPTLIYFGLGIFNPQIFIASAALLSAIAAVVIGSSWSTSATIGVALMGIGYTLGFNPGLVAGAVISGAYFGDKLSPLSDTTNLASGVTNVELFAHIRYLSYTTIPSFVITLLFYLVIGFFIETNVQQTSIEAIQQVLAEKFNINPLLMLVPVLVIFLIAKKVPAMPALFLGIVMGAICALVFQQHLVEELAVVLNATEQGTFQVIMQAVYGDISVVTGNAVLDELLTTNGMYGMLNTIWLIMSAMVFGGAMESSGFLRTITNTIISKVKSTGGLVTSTVATCLLTNVSASDQYLSVVVPGRMFVQAYKDRKVALKNLSRSLEDGGTVTGVLVPWNTCGAFHAGVLGVATLAYAPWALFCLISPLMSIIFAYANIKMAQPNNEEDAAVTV